MKIIEKTIDPYSLDSKYKMSDTIKSNKIKLLLSHFKTHDSKTVNSYLFK